MFWIPKTSHLVETNYVILLILGAAPQTDIINKDLDFQFSLGEYQTAHSQHILNVHTRCSLIVFW